MTKKRENRSNRAKTTTSQGRRTQSMGSYTEDHLDGKQSGGQQQKAATTKQLSPMRESLKALREKHAHLLMSPERAVEFCKEHGISFAPGNVQVTLERKPQQKAPDENQLRMHNQNEEWLREQFPE